MTVRRNAGYAIRLYVYERCCMSFHSSTNGSKPLHHHCMAGGRGVHFFVSSFPASAERGLELQCYKHKIWFELQIAFWCLLVDFDLFSSFLVPAWSSKPCSSMLPVLILSRALKISRTLRKMKEGKAPACAMRDWVLCSHETFSLFMVFFLTFHFHSDTVGPICSPFYFIHNSNRKNHTETQQEYHLIIHTIHLSENVISSCLKVEELLCEKIIWRWGKGQGKRSIQPDCGYLGAFVLQRCTWGRCDQERLFFFQSTIDV